MGWAPGGGVRGSVTTCPLVSQRVPPKPVCRKVSLPHPLCHKASLPRHLCHKVSLPSHLCQSVSLPSPCVTKCPSHARCVTKCPSQAFFFFQNDPRAIRFSNFVTSVKPKLSTNYRRKLSTKLSNGLKPFVL